MHKFLGMHTVPLAMLTVAFLGLTGGLWYVRPNPHAWLFGSLFLGIAWAVVFMRLITRPGAGR